METIIASFVLVFFAEIGDKTQFLALLLATKYRLYEVLLGVFVGIVLNHGIAVILAVFLSSLINISVLKVIAGIMFLLFGFESFILKKNDKEEENIKTKIGAIFTVSLCFFIGELGDKTQITAMSIVFTGKNPILVLIGTTLGMLCVSCLGILAGRIINGKIPKKMLSQISGLCFILFGVDALSKSLPAKYLTMPNVFIALAFIFSVIYVIHIHNKKLLNEKLYQGKYND